MQAPATAAGVPLKLSYAGTLEMVERINAGEQYDAILPPNGAYPALALANKRHHEYATLEHLLLALIDDSDAAAVGWSGYGHRSFLADYYNGSFPGTPARGADFQANPETGDRRTSGSAAGLTGIESALTLRVPCHTLVMMSGRALVATP